MKYRRSKRSRTFRKKRSFKRSIKRRQRPDSGYSEKITYSGEYFTQNGLAAMNIHWLAGGNSGNTDIYPFDCTAQFNQVARVFTQYKITSVSVQYTPYIVTGSITNNIQVNKGVSVATAMNQYLQVIQTEQELRGYLDFKTFSAGRSIKRHYSVWKYAKGLNIGWRSVDDANNGVYNALPDCTTQIHQDTVGYQNYDVGKLTVIWYIKFKTRRHE